MKRTFLLLTAIILCLAACKKEPDLPSDPHVPLMNPFIGVWHVGAEGMEHWQFRTEGTGGKANTMGSFPDNFSFFVYAGQDVQTTPSNGTLVTLEDDGVVTRYNFVIKGNTATLTPAAGGTGIELHRMNGSPQVLSLTNSLIGEWSAQWDGTHGDNQTWSLKYREDGTLKTYHHGMHQFENGYALRNNTLVIFGLWRFSFEPVKAGLTSQENNKWQVIEVKSFPEHPPANWTYTKVANATWK